MTAVGEGATPLMYACQQAREKDCLDILAKKASAAREKDRTQKTPLHYCAENIDTSCAEAILRVAPNVVNARDEDGYSPLHLAVIAGNKPLIQLLLTRGAHVNALDNEKHSVVHWATVCGEHEALEMVLRAGASISSPDMHGGFPLHYAAQMCGPGADLHGDARAWLAVLRTLLACGADVDERDKDGRQPILWAASAGSAEAILALVKAGAKVEAADKDGLTALHCAASRGHTDCLETLVALCGAHVDTIDVNGCTALFYAATLGHADATQLLLSLGAEPNRQDRKGRTPAHCGAAKGQLETLRLLLAGGANLWLRNVKGDLPLHEAVSSGRRELVRWLLNQRPDAVNVANNDGKCPIHVAAINNNVEMIKILLDAGSLVNPVLRSSKGGMLTPLDAALLRGHRGCAKFLQLHGGVPRNKLTDTTAALRGTIPREMLSTDRLTDGDTFQRLPAPEYSVFSASPRFSDTTSALMRTGAEDVAIRHVERIEVPICQHRERHLDGESSEEERRYRRRRRRRRSERRRRESMDDDDDDDDSNEDASQDSSSRPHRKSSRGRSTSDATRKTKKTNRKESRPSQESDNSTGSPAQERSDEVTEDSPDSPPKKPSKKAQSKVKGDSKKDQKEPTKSVAKTVTSKKSGKISKGNGVKPDETTMKKSGKDKVKDEVTAEKERASENSSVDASETGPVVPPALAEEVMVVESAESHLSLPPQPDSSLEENEPALAVTVQVEAQIHQSGIPDETDQLLTSFTVLADDDKAKLDTLATDPETIRQCLLPEPEPDLIREEESIPETVKEVLVAEPEIEVQAPLQLPDQTFISQLAEVIQASCSDEEESPPTRAVTARRRSIVVIEDTKKPETESHAKGEESPPPVSMTRRRSVVADTSLHDGDSSPNASPRQDVAFFKLEDSGIPGRRRSLTPADGSEGHDGVDEESVKVSRGRRQSLVFGDPVSIEGASRRPRRRSDGAAGKSARQGGRRGSMFEKTESEEREELALRAADVDTVIKGVHLAEPELRLGSVGDDSGGSTRYEDSSALPDSGIEPSPRRERSKRPSPNASPGRRVPRLCRKAPGDQSIAPVSVTRAVQNTIRKYHLERKIFYQLLELKRLQIRAGRANEQVLVKRLVDEYQRAGHVAGLNQYTGVYTFRQFERFLYDQLHTLQAGAQLVIPQLKPTDDIETLSAILKRTRAELQDTMADNPALCTHGTHRCLHAAHAYTGIPCAAYITKLNHHTMPKENKSGFLPRIDPALTDSRVRASSRRLDRPPRTDRPVTLELIHGRDKQVISLPTERLDRSKRYYVTFTIKGGATPPQPGSPAPETAMSHQHAKTV